MLKRSWPVVGISLCIAMAPSASAAPISSFTDDSTVGIWTTIPGDPSSGGQSQSGGDHKSSGRSTSVQTGPTRQGSGPGVTGNGTQTDAASTHDSNALDLASQGSSGSYVADPNGTGQQDPIIKPGTMTSDVGLCPVTASSAHVSCTPFVDPSTPAPTPPAATPGATPAPPTQADATSIAKTLILTMHIPNPSVVVSPAPSTNQWNMAFVGVPYWYSTPDPATKHADLTWGPYAMSLDAVRDSVTLDFGDGTVQTCTSMTPRPPVTHGNLDTPSPDCGHTYSQPSLPQGPYTIAAIAHWHVTWTGLGYTGVIPLDTRSVAELNVGELQLIRTR